MNRQSMEAFVQGVLDGTLEDNRARAYAHIRSAGSRGATCEETEIATGMRHQSASSAINHLHHSLGAVAVAGRRPTSTGRQAAVYVAALLPVQRRLI